MNAVRALHGALTSQLLKRPVPIAVTLALTYRCNLRCRYCQIWKDAGEELSTRQVLAAIEELHEAGMCRLGLTGGEPLLRPDIGVIVERARRLGLHTTVFTNGELVREHLGTLRQVDAVLLSLDGPRPIHDAARGDGAFDAAMEALRLLERDRIPVWTNTVLTRDNIDHVDFVVDLARRHGALAAFQPVFEHTYSIKGEKVEALRAEERAYGAVIDHLLEQKRAGAPLLNSASFFEYIRTPRWERNPRTCLAGRCYAAVAPDGRVAPCPILLQAKGLPDGRAIGFAEAFRRSARHARCSGCFCIATVESDMLFSLQPRAVLNTLRLMVRGWKGRSPAARRSGATKGAARRDRRPRAGGLAQGLAVDQCMASVAFHGAVPGADDTKEAGSAR
jgi:MoaA/NifB/PqqE/SkfB family radical SAM enzyme